MDPLFWRLYFADDTHQDEALENSSIRLARRGALVLAACEVVPDPERDLRKPIVRVSLFDEGVRASRAYVPIWYRKRSIPVLLDSRASHLERPRLDITVFGRAREGKHTVETKLWASIDGATIINCPDWAIDQTAIESLLTTA